MIFTVVPAVVPPVTYDHYVSEEYYSEGEEGDSHSIDCCSIPSNL